MEFFEENGDGVELCPVCKITQLRIRLRLYEDKVMCDKCISIKRKKDGKVRRRRR